MRARLPNVEGGEHAKAFRKRRVLNWLPLGLTYAFNPLRPSWRKAILRGGQEVITEKIFLMRNGNEVVTYNVRGIDQKAPLYDTRPPGGMKESVPNT